MIARGFSAQSLFRRHHKVVWPDSKGGQANLGSPFTPGPGCYAWGKGVVVSHRNHPAFSRLSVHSVQARRKIHFDAPLSPFSTVPCPMKPLARLLYTTTDPEPGVSQKVEEDGR